MKTIINIKVDKEAKDKAKKMAEQMGVPLSTIINAHLREFIRSREFSVRLDPVLNPEIEKELIRLSREYHSGKSGKIKFVKSAEGARKILSGK